MQRAGMGSCRDLKALQDASDSGSNVNTMFAQQNQTRGSFDEDSQVKRCDLRARARSTHTAQTDLTVERQLMCAVYSG